jgi:hypothetical protein
VSADGYEDGEMEEYVTLVLVEVCSALMGAIVAVAMCRREEYSNVGHRLAWA